MPNRQPPTEPLRPIPPPVGESIDLRNFPRPWYYPAMTEEGWYIRLDRDRPDLIGIFWRLHTARWKCQRLGFDADPDAMAHLLRVPTERWVNDIYPNLSHILALSDNGRLYLLPGLDACLDAWDINCRNANRPVAARAAQAANEASRKAAEAAAKAAAKAEREAQKAAAKAEREAQKAAAKAEREAAKNSGLRDAVVTPSSQVRPPTSITPQPHAREAEVEGRAPPPGGPTEPTAGCGGSSDTGMVDRIVALYPVWPRGLAARRAKEEEARRMLPKIIEEDPDAAAGDAILATLHREDGWLTKPREPKERRAPHLPSWLTLRRWARGVGAQSSKAAAPAAPEGAPEPARGAGKEAWLDWATAKVQRELATKSLQTVISRVGSPIPGWWPAAAPRGQDRDDLVAALESRLGFSDQYRQAYRV